MLNIVILLFILIIFFLTLSKSKFDDNTSITKKPKIVIIITGQVRTNSCCFDFDKDNIVLDSFNKYFLNIS